MLRDGATRLLIVAFEQTAVSVSSNRIGSFRIDRSKIPIREGIGAGILMVILLSEMLMMLREPGLRAATVILAVMGLISRRRHQVPMDRIHTPWLDQPGRGRNLATKAAMA